MTCARRADRATGALLALLAACAGASGCATAALSDAQRTHAATLVHAVKQDAFPELASHTVALDALTADDVFFESRFDAWAALWGERRYTIAVNPRVLDGTCPEDALRGVLAHELSHTLDYERRDRAGLLALAWIFVSDHDNTRFERWTDLQAVARGYGPALLRYRTWQKSVLTEEQWRKKLAIYYGPRELALLIDVRGRCPHAFYAMLSDPPPDARAIVTHCP